MSEILYGDNDFELTYEYHDNLVFVHLSINNWGKTTLKKVRGVFDLTLSHFEQEGVDVVFGTTESEKSLKLWNIVKPCDEVQELKNGNLRAGWLGAWYTGEV